MRDGIEEKKGEPENLGGSLIASISKAGASDIAADTAEIALDSVLEGGILEEIPIFGLLMKSYNVFGAVRERIFLKKVAGFLAATSNVSESERLIFQSNIQKDLNFARQVGESLILLLDRHDDFEKSYILGKIFSRYIRGHIQYEQFLKAAKSIELAYIGDLRRLETYYKKIRDHDPSEGRFSELLEDHTFQSLYMSGLVRIEGYIASRYYPNEVGDEIVASLSD